MVAPVLPGFMRIDMAYGLVGEQLNEDAVASMHAFSFRGELSMLPPSVAEASKSCASMVIKQLIGIPFGHEYVPDCW
jgi:hypothetical protein